MGRLQNYLGVALIAGFGIFIACPAALAGSKEIPVFVGGRYKRTVEVYEKGDCRYLLARDAARIYGGHVQWYPVSGRVSLKMRRKILRFKGGSSTAWMGERPFSMKAPALIRSDKAFLPMDFFLSGEFSDFSGLQTDFDGDSPSLEVEKVSNLGEVRIFSYRDRSRIEIEAAPEVSYQSVRKGLKTIEVAIPGGIIRENQDLKVEDGVIRSVRLRQGKRSAKLLVRLDISSPRWGIGKKDEPSRILLDVLRPPSARRSKRSPSKAVAPKPSKVPVKSGTAPLAPQVPRARNSASLRASGASGSSGSVPRAGAPGAASSGSGLRAAGKPVIASLPKLSLPLPPIPPCAPVGRKPLIVIDPGHGGKDPGARGPRGVLEKDIVLRVAKDLAALFKREGRFEVILTRETDVFIPLSKRAGFANSNQADLFISIHCNASKNKKWNGFEIYFLSEKASDPWADQVARLENASLKLEEPAAGEGVAAAVLHSLARTEFMNEASVLSSLIDRQVKRRVEIESRGVKQAGFYVLRGVMCPALLVEIGFLSNPGDSARLQNRRFRKRMASALYAGIIKYADKKEWEY